MGGGTTLKSPPTVEERRMMLDVKRGYWRQMDKMLAVVERQEEKRRREEEEVGRARREYEEGEKRRIQRGVGWGWSPGGTKRPHEEDEAELMLLNPDDDPFGEGTSAKRRRLSPDIDYTSSQSQSQDIWPPYPPPAKQYPAPLQSYNPEIYPDAASIIEASSQSQPRNVLPRSDTPPCSSIQQRLEGALSRTDTPPVEVENDPSWNANSTNNSPGKGQKLVHPRHQGGALKRGLSRTQTFAQLIV